ncbi:MFS general substrate transporter [Calocera cornea HHB12733]|uniref:MFS general substrate transporter n=1 Tax=Calocera cornea HHB12733 TaxID=1353952 RepID=A0A165ESM7_9BASI|nr:MFS general substrate transporter [Calocera cornea HHB12733]
MSLSDPYMKTEKEEARLEEEEAEAAEEEAKEGSPAPTLVSDKDGIQHDEAPPTRAELGNQPVLESKELPSADNTERPYSVFARWEKWVIVFITSIAGIHSPLAANLYFPSIPIIAEAFGKSIELINVTVTVYMLFQGLAPTVWGNLADLQWCGRRPIYLACLSLLAVSCIGLALTPTNAYWLLVMLRCFQAAGSASVIALASGTIMDIAASHERGIFLGISGMGPQLGSCIGPVIGGLLTGSLGWRSTFWFLLISSGTTFTVELLFLPETLRAIVGDGSIPAPTYNRPLLPVLGRKFRGKYDPARRPAVPKKAGPLEFVKLFRHPDLLIILGTNAMQFTIFYCIQATTSPLFLEIYPWLTEIQLGLTYLAYGGGCIFGGPISGRLLDWDYQRAKLKAEADREAGIVHDPAKGYRNREGVPVIHTRLRVTPIYWSLYILIVVAYGWSAKVKAPLAVLLILQFWGASSFTNFRALAHCRTAMFMSMSIFNVTQVLIMDLFPGRGSSIAAANNVMRCVPGAIVVSIIQYVLDGVGPGWTFTILSAACALSYPLLILEWIKGPEWARRRDEKEAKAFGV